MSLLYRMGTGNGSGGDLKPFIINFTCDSGFIGKTVTMEFQGTPHAGETVDNVSGTVASDGTLTLYPMHSGNWECSCYSSVIGTTMKKTIELSYWGTTNVEFNDTPDGATVTPTDDVQTWLHCANVWNKSYTTISEVVADTTTLNTLIANENANDYLVRSTTWASDVCSNESAMTYIGLNNYCANKLLADSTWLEAIYSTSETLLKKVLNVYVPTMESNTLPSGEVIFDSFYGDRYPWKAFDKSTSGYGWWEQLNNTNPERFIGYKFDNPTKVICAKYITESQYHLIKTIKYQGSKDKINWIDLSDIINVEGQKGVTFNTEFNSNIDNYTYYRLLIVSSSGHCGVSELQFYAREEV